uniref:Uncharacterized protein n=1 Tax=Salix viminalis TaxID=40686 RepID=A0A6N2MBT7_SALVM
MIVKSRVRGGSLQSEGVKGGRAKATFFFALIEIGISFFPHICLFLQSVLMDLETENRIAAILMKEAAELRQRAEREGVHVYLEQPKVRARPNSRFLTATVRGVQQSQCFIAIRQECEFTWEVAPCLCMIIHCPSVTARPALELLSGFLEKINQIELLRSTRCGEFGKRRSRWMIG